MGLDRDEPIRGVRDSGFLPPQAEALASTASAVRLWLAYREEEPLSTVDGLLLDVMISFNELASEIVPVVEMSELGPSRAPGIFHQISM